MAQKKYIKKRAKLDGFKYYAKIPISVDCLFDLLSHEFVLSDADKIGLINTVCNDFIHMLLLRFPNNVRDVDGYRMCVPVNMRVILEDDFLNIFWSFLPLYSKKI